MICATFAVDWAQAADAHEVQGGCQLRVHEDKEDHDEGDQGNEDEICR